MRIKHGILSKALNPLLILLVMVAITSCETTTALTPTAAPIPTFTPAPTNIIEFNPPGTIDINGQELFLFGANYPWYNYGTDFGENAWGHNGVSAKRGDIESDFELMSQMGIQVVRWFVFADGRATPEFANDGSVTGFDDKVFDDLDAAVEIAQNHNIHLVLVLLDFHWLAPSKEESGVLLGGHSDVIEDPDKLETFYQNALIPLLRRYGANPYIISWEIINEPEWALDDSNIETEDLLVRIPLENMEDFVSKTAQMIHSNSSDQLVTVGSASRRWWNFWENKGLDMCQFHHYDWMDDFTDSQLDFPYANMNTNLPCIVGEFPSAGSVRSVDDYYETIINNGYAGAFPWSLRDNDSSDLGSSSATIQKWAKTLNGYIEIPLPVGWIPPTPFPTSMPAPTPLPTITLDPNLKDDSKYGFEIRQGDWAVQAYEKSLAVTGIKYVYTPDYPVYLGQYALQLNVNLIPGRQSLNNGEVYVEVGKHPPFDNSVGPYNLENSVITCQVYLPKEAYAVNNNPWIAFQVFAKDDFIDEQNGQRSEYGDWTRINIDEVDEWIQISLFPRTFPSPGGWIDPRGFNPNAITLVGVKIGIDDYYAKQGVNYMGSVYLDSCTWK